MQKLTERIHLEHGEEIVTVVRKHWFILFTKVIGPVFLLIAPLGAYPLVAQQPILQNLLAQLQHQHALLSFSYALWFLMVWQLIFLAWTDYYLDLWTITNRRIIAIEQNGLFHRSVASFRYERLQDVNITINGLLATVFDFGGVHAQTAGHDDTFDISGVPNPREVKATILRAADARLAATPQKKRGGANTDGV